MEAARTIAGVPVLFTTMQLESLELQIFVSLVVVLGAAFVALVCDFLKGNNEQLRERNIELRTRQEERDKLGLFQNPMHWIQALASALRPGSAAEPAPAVASGPAAQAARETAREVESFAPIRRTEAEATASTAEPEAPVRRKMYDEIKSRTHSQTWASREEMEQLAERAARIRARHESQRTHEERLKEETAARIAEERLAEEKLVEEKLAEARLAQEARPAVVPKPPVSLHVVPAPVPVVELPAAPVAVPPAESGPAAEAVVEPEPQQAPPVEPVPVYEIPAPVPAPEPVLVTEPEPEPLPVPAPVAEVFAPVAEFNRLAETPVGTEAPPVNSAAQAVFESHPASVWADEPEAAEAKTAIFPAPGPAPQRGLSPRSVDVIALESATADPFREIAKLKVLPIDLSSPSSEPSVVSQVLGAERLETAPGTTSAQPVLVAAPPAAQEPLELFDLDAPSFELPTPSTPVPAPVSVTIPETSAFVLPDLSRAVADSSVPGPGEDSAIPNGLQPAPVLQALLEQSISFSGVAVAIGINDFAALKERMSGNTGLDSLNALNRMVQSMLRPDDFACAFTEDEYILLYPGESGASAQRRLFQVSEKLWDFQLRSLGHLSVMFSWGGLEVRGEKLADAVASARERMYQTRKRKPAPVETTTGSRKRVANG